MTLERNRRWVSKDRLTDVALFLAGFLSVAPQVHNARFGAGFETFTVAHNLVLHGQYANPFPIATGPSALLPPLYPLFLALLMKIFEQAADFATVLTLCHMVAHGLHAALLPRLSELFFRDRLPGICAAFVVILFPVFYFFPHSESIFCPIGLMLFCLATDRRLARGGAGGALFTGLFAGLLVLLNPACVIVCVLWLAYLMWRNRVAYARRSAALIALAFLATLAPWTWRNYQQFHSVFFVRDNLGLELYISNNDLAQPDIVRNFPTGVRAFHPGSSRAEALAVRELGEVEYAHQRLGHRAGLDSESPAPLPHADARAHGIVLVSGCRRLHPGSWFRGGLYQPGRLRGDCSDGAAARADRGFSGGGPGAVSAALLFCAGGRALPHTDSVALAAEHRVRDLGGSGGGIPGAGGASSDHHSSVTPAGLSS